MTSNFKILIERYRRILPGAQQSSKGRMFKEFYEGKKGHQNILLIFQIIVRLSKYFSITINIPPVGCADSSAHRLDALEGGATGF